MESNIHNDQELYSYFIQRNATLCEENFSYLMEHKEVKLMLNDYLSNLLLHKPDDVFKFTKDYYRVLCDKPENNKALVIVGPEGTGKSYLIKKIMEEFPGRFVFPKRTTTRPGCEETHYVVSKEKFLELMNESELVDYTWDKEEYEGLTRDEIKRIAEEDKIAIVEIDITGANRVSNSGIEATYISVTPPSEEKLRERIKQTNKLNTASINQILEHSLKEMKEIENASYFTARVVNDDFETGYEDFKNAIISAFPFLDQNYNSIQKITEEQLHNAHVQKFKDENNYFDS